MPLPDLTKARARASLGAFCERRIPPHAKSQIRLEAVYRGNRVTLVERRPYFRDASAEWTANPIARFDYSASTKRWTLYSRDRNTRWHRYPFIGPATSIDDLIAEVDRDPTCIFWG